MKSQKITEEIRKAIQAWYVNDNLTYCDIANIVGVGTSSVGFWLSGATDSIRPKNWVLLYPHIKPYLPDGYHEPTMPNMATPAELGEIRGEVVPVSAGQMRPVPVLSIAQAAGYEPAIEPLCDYLRETTEETVMFSDVRENYFALRIDGDSMAPDYPHGSVALVASGEFPQRGDIVVAKLADGQVVIKEYHRKDNVITLQSINPAGKSFEWHCKQYPGYVQWMWPVVEINLKTRDRRWAKCRNAFDQ